MGYNRHITNGMENEMTFTLKIKGDGEAFAYESQIETARLLNEAATKDRDGSKSGLLFDINGNSVGEWKKSK